MVLQVLYAETSPSEYPARSIAIVCAIIIWFCYSVLYLSTNETKLPHSVKRFLPFRRLSSFRRWITAWSFLIRGPTIIQNAYDQSNGAPFTVDAPDNRYVVVSSWDHIQEIDAAPESVLSLQGAAKEVLQPKHTMVDFNWHDKKGADGAPLLKTLRNLLTGHLPNVLPELRRSMSGMFDEMHDSHPVVNGIKLSPVYPMVIRAIAQSNAFAFFGKELSANEDFMKTGMVFIEETLVIAEVVRLLPSRFSGHIGRFLARKLNSGKRVYDALEPIVARRFAERERRRLGHDVPEHKDCIHWIMETSPKTKPWSVQRVIHELIAVWFGSVHITSTTACFALFDLCLHKEYIQPLREEIERTTWEAFDESGGKLFPLLDSFMKESARLTPVESVSTRRKALKPFQLSDGTRVETGQWICSAVRGMNLDSAHYASANEFHGFRFVEPEVLARAFSRDSSLPDSFKIPEPGKASQFVELSDWQLWGTGRSACIGRWYASAAIKVMLGLFITKWDMELVDPTASRYFSWRTFIYPYSSTKVILKPRVSRA
ncbi:cytochrome P450 [Xylaria intraflava]|nr:cytochrome P450 [Xylaria intraflava]